MRGELGRSGIFYARRVSTVSVFVPRLCPIVRSDIVPDRRQFHLISFSLQLTAGNYEQIRNRTLGPPRALTLDSGALARFSTTNPVESDLAEFSSFFFRTHLESER